ncbi:MAG: hypothetical protein PUC00_03730 [Clostridiales bacterium]|nr:hypothetical protein [Clostridiales bacterium]
MSQVNTMKPQAVHADHPGRAGWQEDETARLFTAVREANAAGAPLRSVFEALSGDLGRKPNSIRNYYYACLRQQPDAESRTPAFQPFTPEETHELLRQVLMARGQGMSVRACVMQLSGGSHSRMLRYQNKYRTILKTRPEMIAQVCEELQREGLPCPEVTPVPASRIESADAAFCDPEDAAAARLMAQPCVHHMLEGLKELLRRAAKAEAVQTPDRALMDKCDELQRTVDRQQVQFDLQRIAWEKDFGDCAEQLRAVMEALRGYVARDADSELLPEALVSLQNAEGFLAHQQQMMH